MPVRIDAGRGGPGSPQTGGVQVRSRAGAEAAADIGRTLSNFAQPQLSKMRAERSEQEDAADRIDVARTGSATRLEWQKRLTDELDQYDGSEPGFADRLVKSYEEDVRARIGAANPRIQQALELDFVQLGERLTSSAIAGETGKRQAHVMRGLSETLDNEATALLASPDDLPGALEGMERLSEAAPEPLREKFREEGRRILTASYAEALMVEDPSRLYYELDAGLLDSVLDVKDKARLMKSATGQIAQQAAAIERDAAAELKRQQQEVKSLAARVVAYENAGLPAPPELVQQAQDAALRLDDQASLESIALANYRRRNRNQSGSKPASHALDVLEKTFAAGLTPSADAIAEARLQVEASGSAALAKRLGDIAETQGLRQEAAFMDRSALDARLTDLRAGTAGEDELREFTVLSKVQSQRDRRGKTDNVGWAIDNGAKAPAVDLKSETVVGDLAARIDFAEVLADTTGEKLQILSKRERGAIVEQLETMPAPEQAVALARLTAGAGGRSGQLVRELAEKRPALGQIGYLTATGRPEIAVQSLEGAALLKKQPELLPKTKTTMVAVENSVLGSAIPQARQDVREGLVDAARSAYAASLAREGKTGADFDDDDYRDVLQAVAGREGAKGGIGKVNGREVQLPAHMSAQEVNGVLKGMTPEDWTAFSMTGMSAPSGLNDAGDGLEPLAPAMLKRAFLVSVGEGRYQMSLTDPKFGSNYVLDSQSVPESPRPFVLDLSSINPGAVGQRMALDAARARSEKQRDVLPIIAPFSAKPAGQ
ncbi:hypothetical protein [Hyphomonas sp.]|jgi:hypothetical protein|uniref:hypothetical protein n=1 Tax=Hyphomonas sp. TaxID=87 RepID=UPI0032EF4C7A